MIRPVVARAKDLKANGYSLEQIASSLIQEGNNIDLVEAAIATAFDNRLSKELPPRNYNDIKHIVQATLLTQNPKDIIQILTAYTQYGQIMPVNDAEYFQLEELLAYAAHNRSAAVMGEIHETLSEYFNNVIENVTLAARMEKTASTNKREEYIIDKWFEWFGIWPPQIQQCLTTTASQPIISEEYEDGEYTFCPKYKTEINVDNVCKSAGCPFYQEIKTASRQCIKKCKFSK